jgi:hypothetical protein
MEQISTTSLFGGEQLIIHRVKYSGNNLGTIILNEGTNTSTLRNKQIIHRGKTNYTHRNTKLVELIL